MVMTMSEEMMMTIYQSYQSMRKTHIGHKPRNLVIAAAMAFECRSVPWFSDAFRSTKRELTFRQFRNFRASPGEALTGLPSFQLAAWKRNVLEE